jgi:hypothetical protein
MLEFLIITAVLAALWKAYSVGARHGKADVESESLREMAESVRRGIDARRNARGGDDPGGLRKRSFRD